MAAVVPFAAQAADKVITEWDLQTTAGAVKVIRGAADRFEAANPGYKVEDTHILNDAYKTKIKIAFGANEPPCVFSSWGGGPLREYVKAGQVVDLTPYLDSDPAFKDRFLPASFGASTIDGKIYALPAENTAIAVVFYNKELFAKYNVTPPTTWDELLKVIDVFKENGIAPFALANKNKWTGSMFYGYLVDRIGGPEAFANAVQRKDGGSFADPVFVEAGKRLQELVNAGAFQKGYNGLDYDVGGSRRLLYTDKAAMELMGTWEASTIGNENPEFAKKLGFFQFPSVPDGKGDPNNLLGTLGDNYISVSNACPEKDKAVELLKFLTDDTAAAGRLADNRIMPLKDVKTDNPFLTEVYSLVAKAPSVQLWWDQELPPELGELHKDTSQALFGLSKTPEQVAEEFEAAAKAKLQ
ncbi:ABC transporter substrate-binding protein [Pleomorphomonas carboxyditropha]|uniref:ABC transporter substrate-binding protein n=2 Tax=Pleomorphomonas TaxID=261933 RepID=A0A2G9WRS1_9HYPH|nr:ABC transporter substrate-binding protein [Pleomorphomonas carboxyditropha]